MPVATPRQAVRRKRMELILQKALDVSVHAASLVDLRACLESECQGDEELLSAFFPSSTLEPTKHDTSDEVSAQAVLSLRQKVETLFQWLCETHDVDAELLELEDVIHQAEERRLRQVEEKQPKKQENESNNAVKNNTNESVQENKLSPEAQIRVERLRAKQQEQKELEALVHELEAKNKELEKDVEDNRRVAIADVQRMQRMAIQVEEASRLAKDYASSPST
ncbi:hypothetical protein CCR75_002244 [Bremia lactucae]|uniref:Uncharacterized protein n=1 Tax=Bremia lactucae TaxID=4779 RepID=A0A976IFQ6_BRELC|nr:hypothetical protein CCR75_002244 [Bremia lactucae]